MVRVLAVLFAFLAIVSSQGEFFTVFPTGPPENFTQEIHGIDIVGSIFVGVAFVGDRVLVTNCDSNRGVLFSNSYDTTVLGNTMHSSTAVTFPYAGCNLINHPDGYLYYTQVSRGIIKLDPNNGFREAPIAGQLGGQGIYARLGMAVDPQNHDQIFFVSGSYIYILTLSTNKYRMLPGSAAGCHDGMYFNENGTLIVAADPCNNVVRIFRREGGQVAAVPIPGGPDGVAFHSCSNSAYVAVNDGTLWKIDMTTFAATRVASGGTRGDIGAVGPDGCFYLTFLGNTRFRAGVRYSNALVKICSSSCNFAITPGIPTSECGNGKLEDGEDCDGGGCCDTRTCKFLPSNTTCRASAGPCDVEEFCSGTNNTCPEDKFAPATTPCGEIFGMCDVIMKRTCPGDSVKCYGPPPIPALSFEGISWTDFNVISFDTFTCDAGDVEGRLAVKNKANLGDFTLGLQLKLATDSWKTTTLIVGGDAKWNSGSLHPDGSLETVLIAGPAANAFVKGTYTAPDYLAERRHHSIDGVDPAPIFNAGKTYYQAVQAELASLPTNAEATLKYGDGVFIKCQSLSDVYHVKIDSAILSSGKWYSLSNCKFSASWIIDVTGTSNVTIQGQAFPGIVERVIYNVLGSGRFITGNTGVAGHILAPSNTFTATSGVTYGILIAGDIASIRQSNKPNCLTFRPVSIATKVTKPIAIGDKIIYVVDLAAFIAGDLVCVDSDCKKIISGEIRDIDGDGKLDHVITVDAAFAEKHDADGFLTTEVTDADQNRNTPLAVEPSITASTSESPFSEQDKPSFASTLVVAFATLAVVAVLIPLF